MHRINGAMVEIAVDLLEGIPTTSIMPGEGASLGSRSTSSTSSSFEGRSSFGTSSFHKTMFFCPVTMARHSLPSKVCAGRQTNLRRGERNFTIEQSLGLIPVYGRAGEERINLTRRRRVLPDPGLAEVATRNLPLGENER